VPLLIGMDEAGLGPNLGPFVVAASVWDVPMSPDGFDFWAAFESVLTRAPGTNDSRLHVADSKKVFRSGCGIGTLERGVLTTLQLCDASPSTYRQLCELVCLDVDSSSPLASEEKIQKTFGLKSYSTRSLFEDLEPIAKFSRTRTDSRGDLPWYQDNDLALPVMSQDRSLTVPWKMLCLRLGVKLVTICADIVEPQRFNRLVRKDNNKSTATSKIAMQVLRRVWPRDQDCAVLVVADKHGGRNNYESLLRDIFPEKTIVVLQEGAERSIYRIGNGEIHFQPRAEEYGPVAIASMTAKYLRQLAMQQFNGFWCNQIPGLKPTQGYPMDAKRFRSEIANLQRRLEIPDDLLWRHR